MAAVAATNKENRDLHHDSNNVVLFKLSLRSLSNITLILPLSGLFICFITGYIFSPEEIHETHCRVSIFPLTRSRFTFVPLISFSKYILNNFLHISFPIGNNLYTNQYIVISLYLKVIKKNYAAAIFNVL